MPCIINIRKKFIEDIEQKIKYYDDHNFGETPKVHLKEDIDNTINYIKNLKSVKNVYAKPDYDNPQFKYILTPKKLRIFIKINSEQNSVDFVCLVGKTQQFHQYMFVEQLRQTYKELGGDYDEATRQYLAEQARLASMSDVDIAIEDMRRR